METHRYPSYWRRDKLRKLDKSRDYSTVMGVEGLQYYEQDGYIFEKDGFERVGPHVILSGRRNSCYKTRHLAENVIRQMNLNPDTHRIIMYGDGFAITPMREEGS